MLRSTLLKTLVLSGGVQLEPDTLAGKTLLQYLDLDFTHTVSGGGAEVAQLLSHIQPLQELTRLRLGDLWAVAPGSSAATAYSALTASSKLQRLDISNCRFPIGVWGNLFPVGRQLSHLQALDISGVQEPTGDRATAPDGSRLVSCCPSLLAVDLGGLQGLTAERLAPLQGLTGLQGLRFAGSGLTQEGWQAVCQLTGLRELKLDGTGITRELLVQATQLKQLTRFTYKRLAERFDLVAQAPEHEPVWRQVPGAVQQLETAHRQQLEAAQAFTANWLAAATQMPWE